MNTDSPRASTPQSWVWSRKCSGIQLSASGRTERWLVSGLVTCQSGLLKSERSSQSAVAGAPGAVQGLRLRTCMAGGTGSTPGWGTNIPCASQRSWKNNAHQKAPPLCPLSCWRQHSWLFFHRVMDVRVVTGRALASECGPWDWGPSPKSGGWAGGGQSWNQSPAGTEE